jgi:hypothetical protein
MASHSPAAEPPPARDRSVAIVLTGRVAHRNVEAFEASLQELIAAAARQSGQVDAQVLRGSRGSRSQDYHNAYRFRDEAQLSASEAWAERRTLLARGESIRGRRRAPPADWNGGPVQPPVSAAPISNADGTAYVRRDLATGQPRTAAARTKAHPAPVPCAHCQDHAAARARDDLPGEATAHEAARAMAGAARRMASCDHCGAASRRLDGRRPPRGLGRMNTLREHAGPIKAGRQLEELRPLGHAPGNAARSRPSYRGVDRSVDE